MKTCKRHGELIEREIYINPSGVLVCKLCHYDSRERWNKKNKKQYKQCIKNWKDRNRDHIKQYNKEWHIKRKIRHWELENKK